MGRASLRTSTTRLSRCDLDRTLRTQRVIPADLFSRRVVDIQVYACVFRRVCRGFELLTGLKERSVYNPL